jgi:serine protease
MLQGRQVTFPRGKRKERRKANLGTNRTARTGAKTRKLRVNEMENGEMMGRSMRRFSCLLGLALLLAACTKAETSKELPPSTFKVDSGLHPRIVEIPGLDDGPPRSVATMIDTNGTQSEFVQNELIIVTDDESALTAFLSRWQGQVLDSVNPAEANIAGVKPFYLVRVMAPTADTGTLAADLKELVPDARGDFTMGSQEGLDLFGVMAQEGVAGATLTPNWVMLPQGLEVGPTNEGPIGTVASGKAPPGGAPTYTADVNSWPYMQAGGPQDIGVTTAWRALSLANRLGNRINIAVFDGGFKQNSDFPNTLNFGGWEKENPANCGGSPCPWHGTGTASAAFAEVGNSYGAAGPAGPIANRIVVQSPYDLWSVIKYPFELIQTAAARPKIINLSATFVLPAVPAAAAQPALSAFSLLLRLADVLVVAAAGNDGLNLDDRDCFIACWYKRTAFPCELDNVLCVGGMDWGSRNKASFSNYGRNVDIFGPGYVWVVDAAVLNQATLASGTSQASPFVAGIAGLVWAANPSLSTGQVEEILLNTAHRSNGPKVVRAVNAAAAVGTALGNVPPTIRLRANPVSVGLRQEVQLYSLAVTPGPNNLFSVYDLDLEQSTYNVTVRITSDRDTSVNRFHAFQTLGRRTLTITATDQAGASSQAFLTVDVTNTPPTITNVTAPDSVGLGEGWAPITPVIATDANEPTGRLNCDRVRWSVQGNDLPSPSTGCDTFVVFSEQGPRQVTITATDPDGAASTRTLTVNVGPRPAQIKPSVSGFKVRDAKNKELQTLVTLDGFRSQCPLVATATLYNPDDAPVDLSWTLDNGTQLMSDYLRYLDGGRQVEVLCGSLNAGRYFLQLFVGSGKAKKSFTFDLDPIPPR